ncbi:unnamed protein product [Anisakis simplex]|uniref:Transposase n=1 Tax=Anisakis simplex TaxID=6269 RepID=A0A0M3K372_ANISI|nr:unnamed protein product [Anisakis simplex]
MNATDLWASVQREAALLSRFTNADVKLTYACAYNAASRDVLARATSPTRQRSLASPLSRSSSSARCEMPSPLNASSSTTSQTQTSTAVPCSLPNTTCSVR